MIMSNTSEKLIKSLHAEFGGRVHVYKKAYSDKHKVISQWLVANRNECLHILTNIVPFLRYKDEEAKIAIEFLSGIDRNFGGKPLPDEEVDRRNSLIVRLRSVDGRRNFPRTDPVIGYRPGAKSNSHKKEVREPQ